jgi:hypothetical protein
VKKKRKAALKILKVDKLRKVNFAIRMAKGQWSGEAQN